MTSINERVNQVRKASGLTQQKFAETLGISQTHISNVESHKENPSTSVLKLISIKFSINEHWLLTGEGSVVPVQTNKEQAISQLKVKINEFNATSALVEKQISEIEEFLSILTA